MREHHFFSEISFVREIYAINTKKNQVGSNPQGSLSNDKYLTDSIISIADLLGYVNQYFCVMVILYRYSTTRVYSLITLREQI